MNRFFKRSMIKNLKLQWMSVVLLLIASFACYPPDSSLLPSLTMSKTTYDVNETIVVNYNSIPGNATNCVGIFVAGTSNEAFLQCIYSNGDANGTMSFDGLPDAGEYNARLFFIVNDSYILEYEVSFTVGGDNQSPIVSFTQPGAGTVSHNIGVVVEASDPDGSIRDVDLYINSTHVRTESNAPYEWGTANDTADDPLLLNCAPGVYQLRAVATDNDGDSTSVTLSVTVEEEGSDGSDTYFDEDADGNGSDQPDNRVKVFILAGQSNMQGKGIIEPAQKHLDKNDGMGTLRYLVNEQTRKYRHLVDSSGNWIERNDVWLVDLEKSGPLTAKGRINFGPELQFGFVVGDHYTNNQVVIIKTAWGGKSLYVDFRPPSSGGSIGPYYIEMVNRVHEVLDNLKNYYPNYKGQGYNIVGFGWHQGWNDKVNLDAIDEYQENCVNLVNDLRDEFQLPEMPFVLAITGMGGWENTSEKALKLKNAQLSVPSDDRLKRKINVAAVETRDFWRESEFSPGSQSCHWNQNAESYFLIGEGMGEAIVDFSDTYFDEDADGNGSQNTFLVSMPLTVTRIDARPPGHPLDSGIEPDPIIEVAFMKAEGALGSSATKLQITGPSVIRVPDWIPDSEKTHPDAKYYM